MNEVYIGRKPITYPDYHSLSYFEKIDDWMLISNVAEFGYEEIPGWATIETDFDPNDPVQKMLNQSNNFYSFKMNFGPGEIFFFVGVPNRIDVTPDRAKFRISICSDVFRKDAA